MLRVLFEVLYLLLVVEHQPALRAKYLPVALGLYVLDLGNEVFPLLAILFNHLLYKDWLS